jgi:NADH-quinone oxidoreductase subunit J
METIVFYILAGIILTFATMTVFSRRIFRAAIYLLITLTGVAGVYLMMEMNFIAALQIVIYVGGIVVLIIFSVFLTHRSGEKIPSQSLKRIIVSGLIGVVGLAFVLSVLFGYTFTKSTEIAVLPSVQNIGRQMLNYKEFGYVFPFEIISIFLLAALVGSIVIAMKSSEAEK